MIFTLTHYLDEIEKAYKNARNEYEKVTAQLDELRRNHESKINSNMLNHEGISKENSSYKDRKRSLEKQFDTIREQFTKEVEDIGRRENSIFKKKYTANVEDIDLKAAEMLKSGMLSESEISEMALNYRENGNNAMYRYCGTFLDKNSKDVSIREIAQDSTRTYQRPDTEAIDSFIDICNKGLRSDVALANGIHARHEDLVYNIYSFAEGVEVTD